VVVVSLESGFALTSLLLECRFGLLIKIGRLVSVAASPKLGFDILVGVGLGGRFLGVVFDLGLGFLADLKIADAGFDSRGKRVANASPWLAAWMSSTDS